MTDDPFDPIFDPDGAGAEAVPRRRALTLLLAGPTALALVSGCAQRRIACVVPGEASEGPCEHRFCRYHRASSGG